MLPAAPCVMPKMLLFIALMLGIVYQICCTNNASINFISESQLNASQARVPSPLAPPPVAPKAPMPMKLSQQPDDTFGQVGSQVDGPSTVGSLNLVTSSAGRQKTSAIADGLFIGRMETVSSDTGLTEDTTAHDTGTEGNIGLRRQPEGVKHQLQNGKNRKMPWLLRILRSKAHLSQAQAQAQPMETTGESKTNRVVGIGLPIKVEEAGSTENESIQDKPPAAEGDFNATGMVDINGVNIGYNGSMAMAILRKRIDVDVTGRETRSDAERGFLQKLMFTQFTWVDIIIATGCTIAIILVLINIGVFIQYCVQRGRRGRLYEPPPPAPHTYRLRMDSLRVRSPSKKSRLGRVLQRTFCHSSSSATSTRKTSISSLSMSDVATQYESMDAMLASFISNELIVELNDRDSTCTSVSEGFTFSRDYGSTQNIVDGTTQF